MTQTTEYHKRFKINPANAETLRDCIKPLIGKVFMFDYAGFGVEEGPYTGQKRWMISRDHDYELTEDQKGLWFPEEDLEDISFVVSKQTTPSLLVSAGLNDLDAQILQNQVDGCGNKMTTQTTTKDLIAETHKWEELANTTEMKVFILAIRSRLQWIVDYDYSKSVYDLRENIRKADHD